MLELRNIVKVYQGGTVNETCLFNDFSLSIPDKQFVCVVGSNGSGKTSLLNIICGSIPIDEGKIMIGNEDITHMPEHKRHRRIGRVYQDPSRGTCPSMTILENMSMADNKGKPFNLLPCVNRKKTEEYRSMLAQLGLGLEDKMGVPVGNLSGGQRQALTLLMSTLQRPRLLLLDEHTAALDPKTAKKVLDLTAEMVEEQKLTTLMITHNMRDAIQMGNRLIMMHEGNIIYDVAGEEKKHLTVEDLLHKFEEASGEEFANDRMMLAK